MKREGKRQNPYSTLRLLPSHCLWTLGLGFWTFHCLWRRVALFVSAAGILLPAMAFAQIGSSGAWPIQVYGLVQVEPGPNVLTFAVKDEQIRFAVNDVRAVDRRFSMVRFLSDTKHHTPSLYIRGSDSLLDLLVKERPSKRVLRLTGLYYIDTRVFVVSAIDPFREPQKPPF